MEVIAMLLSKRYPFWDIERTLEEMNRVFDVFSGPVGLRSMPVGTFPALNVYDAGDKLVVTAEMPGVDPKDIDLNVVENNLTISGKRDAAPEDQQVQYYRRERFSGQFSRSISLAEKVNPDAVKATYKNGILTIELPKAQEAKPRSIKIKAE
jgi:HSP20 family protein